MDSSCSVPYDYSTNFFRHRTCAIVFLFDWDPARDCIMAQHRSQDHLSASICLVNLSLHGLLKYTEAQAQSLCFSDAEACYHVAMTHSHDSEARRGTSRFHPLLEQRHFPLLYERLKFTKSSYCRRLCYLSWFFNSFVYSFCTIQIRGTRAA